MATRRKSTTKPAARAKLRATSGKARPGADPARSKILEAFTPEQAALLAPHVRPAWLPRVKAGTAAGPVSKIGGAPWLPEGVEWPECPGCHGPVQLFVQLDLESLPAPAGLAGAGLAQLFYCTSTDPACAIDCEAYAPFSRSVVARLVDRHGPGRDAAERAFEGPIAPRLIAGWDAADDLPNLDELEELGVEIEFDGPLYRALESCKQPLLGDKLGGWPFWSQTVRYPDCPACKAPMRLFFQIDSNDKVGYQWGDQGCAHWFQCARHPRQMAFSWQCG